MLIVCHCYDDSFNTCPINDLNILAIEACAIYLPKWLSSLCRYYSGVPGVGVWGQSYFSPLNPYSPRFHCKSEDGWCFLRRSCGGLSSNGPWWLGPSPHSNLPTASEDPGNYLGVLGQVPKTGWGGTCRVGIGLLVICHSVFKVGYLSIEKIHIWTHGMTELLSNPSDEIGDLPLYQL